MTPRELNFTGTSPLLYLIATPIGNLSEMTQRAIDVLKETDYIAAEDTRNSGQLMSHFLIDKPFISCREHNEEEAGNRIVSLLLEGKKVCYMSDAGYPAISDPGSRLVAKCLANGIKVSVTSGPSAAINALVCSGLDSSHFYYFGFLPAKEGERDTELGKLAKREETIIFYESPHRIKKTLQAMFSVFGDRKAVIARELTIAHEEFVRGTLGELASLDETTLKGEMVVIVEGRNCEDEVITDEAIIDMLNKELATGCKSKEAITKVAKENELPKNRVYDLYLSKIK